MHQCTHTNVHLHTYINVHLYICIPVYIYIYIYMHAYIYLYICDICTCTHIYVCVCFPLAMHLRCALRHANKLIHTEKNANRHAGDSQTCHTPTYKPANLHTRTHMRVYAPMLTWMHVYVWQSCGRMWACFSSRCCRLPPPSTRARARCRCGALAAAPSAPAKGSVPYQ